MDPELLSEAIVTWIWAPSKSYPTEDDNALLARFGPADGPTVLTEIRTVKDDFFRSTAFREVHGVAAIGDHAAAEFRSRHPEINEDAVQALAASYTYAYK